ncbi:MAG: aminotransferase class I/II-fold pyridoxal phosphate-dependent enzyme [Candidatus Nealsonbacteria bacterium]
MISFRPISISLSPNTETDDVWLAFRLIFQPWLWISGRAPERLEERFKEYIGLKHAFSFNSGRSSFLAVLSALELDKGSEILLQAFTCNAACNPVIWSGLKPVYVDCSEDTFNIDTEDLKRKITKNSRAVVVQHTFGLPADLDEVLDICRENNLILIEDCAHSLGAEYKGRKVGNFGKVSFFSFSRDKVISSVYGGMAATNDDELAERIKEYQIKSGFPSPLWILQQIVHPVSMNWKILPTYRFFGKYLLVLAQKINFLSKAVIKKEKKGLKPGYFPKRMPSGLAILADNQFKKVDRFNSHRKKIAEFYKKELIGTPFKLPSESDQIYLRFVLKHKEAHDIIKKAWKLNLLIGDWYTFPIVPPDTDLDKMGYVLGSCKTAERLSKETFNLPTHINISKEQARVVVNFLKSLNY